MSLTTYYLEYGRHAAGLHRRRAYVPMSNTASHDNHEKITSWVSFNSLYGYGAPLGIWTAGASLLIFISWHLIINLKPISKVYHMTCTTYMYKECSYNDMNDQSDNDHTR